MTISSGLTTPQWVVGCGECVVYLTSPGRPTDIAYNWTKLVAGKDRGEMFLFLLFLHFHLFSFLSCPSLSSPLLSLLSLFSLSLGDDTK